MRLSCQVRLGYSRLIQVRLGQTKLREVKLLGQVKFGEAERFGSFTIPTVNFGFKTISQIKKESNTVHSKKQQFRAINIMDVSKKEKKNYSHKIAPETLTPPKVVLKHYPRKYRKSGREDIDFLASKIQKRPENTKNI